MCPMPEPRIHENLRAARESAGLPQHKIAAALGMGEQVYGRMERGERPMRAIELWRVARFLGIEPEALFKVNPSTQNAIAA